MPLDTPIRLRPGKSVGLYVHSQRQGDQAIVSYANAHQKKLLEEFIKKTGLKCVFPQ